MSIIHFYTESNNHWLYTEFTATLYAIFVKFLFLTVLDNLVGEVVNEKEREGVIVNIFILDNTMMIVMNKQVSSNLAEL